MIKLKDKKIIQLFFLVFLIKVINGYTFTYINNRYFKLENAIFGEISEKELFFIAVILAPIIETLIFQLLLYRIINKIRISNTTIVIILMAFTFSQAHWYHWLYVVAAFINGLFLNYFYVNIFKKKNELIAVSLTIALHSSYNLYGFLFVE